MYPFCCWFFSHAWRLQSKQFCQLFRSQECIFNILFYIPYRLPNRTFWWIILLFDSRLTMFILNLSESPESQWFSTSHPTQDIITFYITFYTFLQSIWHFPLGTLNPITNTTNTLQYVYLSLSVILWLWHIQTHLEDTEGPVPESHNQVSHTFFWFPVHMKVMLILYYYTVIQ